MLACPDDVPTLQNFAYGDTPTQASIKALLNDLLGRGNEFDVSLYELSGRHDLRQLVLKTVLTYLELMGVLRQGTPFYAGYEFRPNPGHSPATIAEAFPGEPGKLIADLFRIAKKGRLWSAINPDDAVTQLGQERRRITRALEVIEERGMIELRVADSRLRYFRLRETEDADALAAELMGRFSGREKAEMERLQRVLDLVTLDKCQVNALTGYFGEMRETPCGHCGICLTGRRAKLPPPAPLPPLPAALESEMRMLRAEFPDALGQPRQIARFLCGLSSPALTKARLPRNPRFASLEERPFTDVLAWCEGL
jgi:ATP-dependent DNA helicase RecQ